MAEPLTPEEEAALRSLPRGGTPFEINGAIERDGLDFELSDATRYDRRILLVSLRSALAALDAARAAAPAGEPGLDVAWAEAEAALPEKHAGITLRTDGDWGRIDGYQAWTYAAGEPTISVSGPTPAAALRTLAARLKGDSDAG